MKLIVEKKYLDGSAEQFIQRKASYGAIHSHHTGHDSFVRHPGRNRYPRFHMYLKDEGDRVVFDLHLDQKETSYGGSHAHNAEYDGPVVSAEMARVKDLVRANLPQSGVVSTASTPNRQATSAPASNVPRSIIDEDVKKKGFWSKLFA
jgi:hypothetical protein